MIGREVNEDRVDPYGGFGRDLDRVAPSVWFGFELAVRNLRGGLRAQADAARRPLADVAGGGAGAPPRRDAGRQFGLRERRRDGGPGGAGGRHRRSPRSCRAGHLPGDGRRRSRDAAEPAGTRSGRRGDGASLAHDRRWQLGEAIAAPCEVGDAGVYSRACSELPLQNAYLVLSPCKGSLRARPTQKRLALVSGQEGTRRRLPNRLSWG